MIKFLEIKYNSLSDLFGYKEMEKLLPFVQKTLDPNAYLDIKKKAIGNFAIIKLHIDKENEKTLRYGKEWTIEYVDFNRPEYYLDNNPKDNQLFWPSYEDVFPQNTNVRKFMLEVFKWFK